MTHSMLRRAGAVLAVVATALLGVAAVTTAPAQAARWVPAHTAAAQWAPAATAPIHPGTMMYTDGAQCTANFVYTDSAGNVYVGYAAHCAGTGGQTDTHGCSTRPGPPGAPPPLPHHRQPRSPGASRRPRQPRFSPRGQKEHPRPTPAQ